MNRLIHVTLAVLLAGVMLVGPASAAPADAVVGNGTPLSCSESNFDAAVAGGGTITFDCGGPLTIQLTSPASITTDTTIDGGSAITLTGHLAPAVHRRRRRQSVAEEYHPGSGLWEPFVRWCYSQRRQFVAGQRHHPGQRRRSEWRRHLCDRASIDPQQHPEEQQRQ